MKTCDEVHRDSIVPFRCTGRFLRPFSGPVCARLQRESLCDQSSIAQLALSRMSNRFARMQGLQTMSSSPFTGSRRMFRRRKKNCGSNCYGNCKVRWATDLSKSKESCGGATLWLCWWLGGHSSCRRYINFSSREFSIQGR